MRRDTNKAAWWIRWLARSLARREATALSAAEGVRGIGRSIPRLLANENGILERSYLPGQPMHEARPRSPAYFRDALKLLCRLHRGGIVHNDLAKEPNWLCLPDGGPAIVDFQLAWVAKRRGRMFRVLAREDLRHLMKHKRTYLPGALTNRQRALLDAPSGLTRLWRAAVKPPYLFFTRRILGWAEREGPAER